MPLYQQSLFDVGKFYRGEVFASYMSAKCFYPIQREIAIFRYFFANIACEIFRLNVRQWHDVDVTMSAMAYQITSLPVVCSTVCSGADQRNPQSSTLLAFVRKITSERWNPSQRFSNAGYGYIWWYRHAFLQNSLWTILLLLVYISNSWMTGDRRRRDYHVTYLHTICAVLCLVVRWRENTNCGFRILWVMQS